jgi:hypothetical protein
MSDRCPACGSRSALHYSDGKSHCFTCSLHPAPHDPRGRFNPRCALCWAEVWAALVSSLRICAWRAMGKREREMRA